ncbi:MAG: hypothetical protein H7210_07240, partial [Pyrinomonadaceae bacterium]|nr:hypothetical protein [Phycisphaerales bacterium]
PRWQIRHEYADPMTLRAGTTLRLQGIHDNSAGNPNNPDANRQVATGAGSGDEALLVALEVLVPVPASKEK